MKAWNTRPRLPRPRGCHIGLPHQTPPPPNLSAHGVGKDRTLPLVLRPQKWGGGRSAGEACLVEGGPQAAGSHQPRPWLLPSPGLSVPSLPRAFGLHLSVHCILPSPPGRAPAQTGQPQKHTRTVLFFVWLGGRLAAPSPPPLPAGRQPQNSAPRSKQGLPLEVTDVERILPRVSPNSPGFSIPDQ